MGFFRDKRTCDPKWTAGDETHDAALAESGVSVEAASRIRAMPTRWLVQDVVPDEAVTIIGGAAGAGKSFFACQLAADVARQLRGRVVFATAGYERPELLRWRLDQADGDARRIAIAALTPPRGVFDQRRTPRKDEIDERMSILYYTIEGAADPESGILPQVSVASGQLSAGPDGDPAGNGPRTTDNGPQSVRLLVIDDVDGWFGTPGNMLSAAALARVIQRLNELAVEKKVAIVVLARVQLSVEGRITARQLSRIAHAASVVWMVANDREEGTGQREQRETEGGSEGAAERRSESSEINPKSKIQNPKSRRWLMPVKNNLAEDGAVPGLAFELVEGRIRWRKEPVPELAEVLLPSVHNNDRRRLRRAACEWLQEALADGPMPSGEVIKQALSCGISRGTLQRAITDLGIKSHKSGFNGGWEMRWTPALEPRRPVAWSGLRVVGAGDEPCGQADTETRGHGEGERERESEGATERGREELSRQGDKETRRQGEGERERRSDGEKERRRGGSGQWAVDSERRADVNANCASSENCGDSSMANCASSENREEIDATSCASSAAENPDVATSPNLATAAKEAPQPVKPVEGDLRSNGCQGPETLTERERVSCASSKKQGDSSRTNCACSAVSNPKSDIDNSANRSHPGPGYPIAGAERDGKEETERVSEGTMEGRIEDQTPKTQDLRPKTSDSNPKSKIENPKSAAHALEEEEPMPHWMKRWYADAVRRAC